jgi:hypothetical protein
MRAVRMRRAFSTLVVMVLLVGTMSLTGMGTAGACEEQIQLPAIARGYDAGDARYLDGIVTNDTSETVVPAYVKVSWAEGTKKSDVWICSGPIKPGEWTAFHADWPCGVPSTWTPIVTGYASPSDADDKPLALTVDSIGAAVAGDAGERTFDVTVTNNNAVPVSNLNVVGIERDASSSEFVDALDSCGAPCELAVGESATFDVTGYSPWEAGTTPDLYVTALEQPTITLGASTTSPAYGSPVTFTLSLKFADGSPAIGGRTLKLFSSHDGERWCDYRPYDTDTGTAVALATPGKPTYYKAIYWGGDDLGFAESDVIFVKPQVAVTKPVVPASVRRRHAFRVSGRMCAGDKSGTKPVVISVERKRGSRWVKATTGTANADSAGRYKKSVKLSSAGTYRIRAYRVGVGYTRYSSLKVKY